MVEVIICNFFFEPEHWLRISYKVNLEVSKVLTSELKLSDKFNYLFNITLASDIESFQMTNKSRDTKKKVVNYTFAIPSNHIEHFNPIHQYVDYCIEAVCRVFPDSELAFNRVSIYDSLVKKIVGNKEFIWEDDL